MDLGIAGKVALVTAASRGLGRAASEALLAEGARLVVLARSSDDLRTLAAPFSDRCVVMPGNLLDPSVPERAVRYAIDTFGKLDIVVVNTPGPPAVQPLAASDEDLAGAFDSAFYPAVRLIRAAIPAMYATGWGRVVIVSSTSVRAPKPFLALSATARSALWAWAKSAAPELFERGITINALFAGPHATDRVRQLGAKPFATGTPEHFGQLVAMMCSEATRFVTGTGQIIDGGELRGS